MGENQRCGIKMGKSWSMELDQRSSKPISAANAANSHSLTISTRPVISTNPVTFNPGDSAIYLQSEPNPCRSVIIIKPLAKRISVVDVNRSSIDHIRVINVKAERLTLT